MLTVADVFIAPEERLNFEGRWVPVADDEVTWSHDRLRYSVQIVPDPFVKPALVEWLTKPSADGNDPVVPWQLLAVGVGGQPAEVGPREPGRYTIGVAVTMIADSFTGSR